MRRYSLVIFLILLIKFTVITSQNKKSSVPTLQKTVEALFTERTNIIYPEQCKWIRSSPRQAKLCKRDPAIVDVISTARAQAITACEETFTYDRWNCSINFNNKRKRNIFNQIYRETAFVFSLISASFAHAVAKGCASGNLLQCSCHKSINKSVHKWKSGGCGDDLRYGKRLTRNFLEFKKAGTDQIAEVLKQNIIVGIDAVSEQLREVCKCHGFSGSCTTKTCWKRLTPFSSTMGLLKKQYHHAVRTKIVNYTTKRAIMPKVRKRMRTDRKSLLYLEKTPNLCAGTVGRSCKDKQNCATLCCGRRYERRERTVEVRCNCKMVNCCFVKCDTCKQTVEYFVCK